jgi:hypothetical protein
MSTKTGKTMLTFGIIVASLLIGMMFIMSGSAFAAVAVPNAGVVHPAINQPLAPRVGPGPIIAPRPAVESRPFFAPQPFEQPFFPGFNPFFFNEGLNPFFFNQEGFVD